MVYRTPMYEHSCVYRDNPRGIQREPSFVNDTSLVKKRTIDHAVLPIGSFYKIIEAYNILESLVSMWYQEKGMVTAKRI